MNDLWMKNVEQILSELIRHDHYQMDSHNLTDLLCEAQESRGVVLKKFICKECKSLYYHQDRESYCPKCNKNYKVVPMDYYLHPEKYEPELVQYDLQSKCTDCGKIWGSYKAYCRANETALLERAKKSHTHPEPYTCTNNNCAYRRDFEYVENAKKQMQGKEETAEEMYGPG